MYEKNKNLNCNVVKPVKINRIHIHQKRNIEKCKSPFQLRSSRILQFQALQLLPRFNLRSRNETTTI
jgi:hypothetical protein